MAGMPSPYEDYPLGSNPLQPVVDAVGGYFSRAKNEIGSDPLGAAANLGRGMIRSIPQGLAMLGDAMVKDKTYGLVDPGLSKKVDDSLAASPIASNNTTMDATGEFSGPPMALLSKVPRAIRHVREFLSPKVSYHVTKDGMTRYKIYGDDPDVARNEFTAYTGDPKNPQQIGAVSAYKHGALRDNEPGHMAMADVKDPYRGQGVGYNLYNRAREWGGRMEPSGQLSLAAQKYWSKYDPEMFQAKLDRILERHLTQEARGHNPPGWLEDQLSNFTHPTYGYGAPEARELVDGAVTWAWQKAQERGLRPKGAPAPKTVTESIEPGRGGWYPPGEAPWEKGPQWRR